MDYRPILSYRDALSSYPLDGVSVLVSVVELLALLSLPLPPRCNTGPAPPSSILTPILTPIR